MHSDFMTVTGKSHAICQDYAGKFDNGVLLSDGCSSSPHTDFGSRFLVRNAMMYDDYDKIISSAESNAKQLNLPIECLDATLLGVTVMDDFCIANIYGDGLLAICYDSGVICVYSLEYSSNAPRYLSYRLNNREEIYQKQCGDAPVYLQKEIFEYKKDKVYRKSKIHENTTHFSDVIPTKHIEWIAIMSDGVKSFSTVEVGDARKNIVSIDTSVILPMLLDFVNFKGDFVQRQMRWFLDETKKLGWSHYDDLSLAVVVL